MALPGIVTPLRITPIFCLKNRRLFLSQKVNSFSNSEIDKSESKVHDEALYFNKPNVRVERPWVETPGVWIQFSVSGRLFTPYQEFLSNLECLCRTKKTQKNPKKPPETCFCGLKTSNNTIMKIVKSEVDFRVLHSNGEANLVMQLICKTPVPGLSSVKILAQSFRYLALHLRRTTRTRWNKHASPFES